MWNRRCIFLVSKNGSITEDLSDEKMNYLKSDVVLSSATIEHVGSYENQKKMIKNVALLTNKIFLLLLLTNIIL